MAIINSYHRDSVVLEAGGTDMLRVAPDGFYVRGVKLEQNEQEAQQVYESFKAWLAWAQLNKQTY